MSNSPIKQAMDGVRRGVKDLSEVRVTTFTGSAQAIVNASTGADGKPLAMDAMLANFTPDNADIQMAYMSVLDLDGDAIFFRADGAPEDLAVPHREAVAAGVESRAAIIGLFKDLVSWAVGGDDDA